MTAVDLDALDKLRGAIRDELAGWPIGDGYYSTAIGIDDAGELADFLLAGSLIALIAEARKYRALREAVEGLAKELGSRDLLSTTNARHVAVRLRAVVATVDPKKE